MSTKLTTLLGVALLVLAAACGDTGLSTLEEEADTATEEDGTSAGDDSDISEDDVDLGELDDLGDIPGISDECAALVQVMGGLSALFLGDGADEADELFALGIDDLPGSLSDEVETLREAAEQYTDVLDELGIDPTDATSFAELSEEEQLRFAQASEIFNEPEVIQALDTLEAYATEECAQFTP